ncbi:hypothetical protein OB920_09360 [Halobacteria archaeon HArc-gm2]|nr:hypothetical protein [Halobacteria archaeon HArc-gm2]
MRLGSRIPLVPALSGFFAVLGLALAAYLLVTVSGDQSGGGFVAGLAVALALVVGTTSLVALGEAILLALSLRRSDPTGWSRRLLEAGALAGGLASLFPLLSTGFVFVTPYRSELNALAYRAIGPLFGAWAVLTVVGFFAFVAGGVWHLRIATRGSRTDA